MPGGRCLVAPEPQGTIELFLIVSGMTALGSRVNGVPLPVGRLIMLMHHALPGACGTAPQRSTSIEAQQQEPLSPGALETDIVHDGASW